MTNLTTVRKTVAAVLGALGTWAAATFTNSPIHVTSGQWVALGIALATALGVYATPNSPAAATATRTVSQPRKASGEKGAVSERLLFAVLIVAGAIVAAHFLGWLGLLILLLLLLLIF